MALRLKSRYEQKTVWTLGRGEVGARLSDLSVLELSSVNRRGCLADGIKDMSGY